MSRKTDTKRRSMEAASWIVFVYVTSVTGLLGNTVDRDSLVADAHAFCACW